VKELGRLLTAMVTPFKENGEVDYEQAKKLAVREEELRLFTEVKAALGDRGSVVAGTGSNSTSEAVAATQAAEKVGVDACLLVVPYYNKPSQEGLYQHFRTIAESTSLPCILYNVPSRTITSLSVETIVRGLSAMPVRVSASGVVMTPILLPFWRWAATVSSVFPPTWWASRPGKWLTRWLPVRLMKPPLFTATCCPDEAAAIHRHLLPLVNALFVVSNPSPVKYALNHIGFRVGKPRLPLVEPDEKSAAVIRETLKNYKVDLPV